MTTDNLRIGDEYLAAVRHQMLGCHRIIQHCVEQLSDEQLWQRTGEGFNSIANLLLHLRGNIEQRILSLIAGEPDRRNRQQEFDERRPIPKAELWGRFDDTIRRADAFLATLRAERLLETRTYGMLAGDVEGTLVDLILYTLVHLGGHSQEIVALTRLQLRENYKFLRTPAKP